MKTVFLSIGTRKACSKQEWVYPEPPSGWFNFPGPPQLVTTYGQCYRFNGPCANDRDCYGTLVCERQCHFEASGNDKSFCCVGTFTSERFCVENCVILTNNCLAWLILASVIVRVHIFRSGYLQTWIAKRPMHYMNARKFWVSRGGVGVQQLND